MVYDEERKSAHELSAVCRALGVTSYYNQGQKCLEAIDQMKKSGGITPDMIHMIRNLHTLVDSLERGLEGGGGLE